MAVISSYTAATDLTDDDVLIGNDGAVTKKFSGAIIKAAIKAYPTTNTLNTRTANYTLVIGDANDNVIVVMNVGSANTLTVPPNSSVAFPVGSQIEVLQIGAGQTTITEGAGVVVNKTFTLKLAARYARCTLLKTATDTWVVSGEMALS